MAKRKIRPIRVEGNIAVLTLTKGYEAVIEAADVPLVSGYNWCARVDFKPDGGVRGVYAFRRAPRGSSTALIHLHRVIHPVADGNFVATSTATD